MVGSKQQLSMSTGAILYRIWLSEFARRMEDDLAGRLGLYAQAKAAARSVRVGAGVVDEVAQAMCAAAPDSLDFTAPGIRGTFIARARYALGLEPLPVLP